MRYVQRFFIIFMVLFLLTIGEVEAAAMNTGFSTEALQEDDIETFLNNIHLHTLAEEPEKRPIECFDVHENGTVAIGCSDYNNKIVCVYTGEGVFQYGYSFECSGDFGVELDNNILIIYFVRSDVAIAVNSMGEVESILKIQNTSENDSYWRNSVFSIKRKVGNREYMLKNTMGIFNVFASSYSQLIVTDETQEVRILYNVNSSQLFNTVAIFVGVLALISIVVAILILTFVKLKRRKMQQ